MAKKKTISRINKERFEHSVFLKAATVHDVKWQDENSTFHLCYGMRVFYKIGDRLQETVIAYSPSEVDRKQQANWLKEKLKEGNLYVTDISSPSERS